MQEEKRKESFLGLTREVLAAVGSGGLIITAIVVPGTGYIFNYIERSRLQKAHARGYLTRTVKRLEKQELVSWREVNGILTLIISNRGVKQTLRSKIDDIRLTVPEKWDRKYRVITFDIPEQKKYARELLRAKLKEWSFTQLQKSVFVTRVPCKDELQLLIQALEISEYVSYIVATSID